MSARSRPPLSLEEVAHVAKLARLRLSQSHLQQYSTQLSAILDYIDKLNELDVTGVEPLAHPTGVTNRLDDDEVAAPMPIEHLLRNAPAIEDRYLAVPKVLTDES